MAQESKQNELRNTSKGRIGSINHLRLTVTDIQRAERFYRPLMGFMEYELCDREEHRFSVGQMVVIGCLLVNFDRSPQGHKACPARFALSGISSPRLERRQQRSGRQILSLAGKTVQRYSTRLRSTTTNWVLRRFLHRP